MSVDPNWIIGLVGALFGSAGLKVVEKMLNRKLEEQKQEAAKRKELSDQIASLTTQQESKEKRIDEVEAELEDCRDKYWKLREEYTRVQSELWSAVQQIKLLSNKAEKVVINSEIDEPPPPPTSGA